MPRLIPDLPHPTSPLITLVNNVWVMNRDWWGKLNEILTGIRSSTPSGAVTTTAVDGFLYVPTCPGPPTGTPTAYAGLAPLVVDSVNNKLYFYSGGAWRDAGP